MRSAILFYASLAVIGGVVRCDDIPDSPCAFCTATAEVLAKRVENEKPRNHLDLRHRLDKEGMRYGKILDFKLSELRIFELLDDLSADLDEHVPFESESGVISWQHPQSGHGNRSSIPGEELRFRRRHLRRWCEHAIEVHEDAVTELLQSDALSLGGIHDVLCVKLTRSCAAPPKVEL